MPLTMKQVDELEKAALQFGSVGAIKALAAAARESADVDEPKYRVETSDGIVRVVTVREYLSFTATDLARSKIELVRG